MSPKLKKSFWPIKTWEAKRTNQNAEQIPLYLNKRRGICFEFRGFYAPDTYLVDGNLSFHKRRLNLNIVECIKN